MNKIKKAEADEVQEIPKQEEEEPSPEEPKKELTVEEVLVNHENRLIQMESKWFRLGGI